jgi:phosphoserine phosphatase
VSVLVTVTGPDHPGITAALAALLARSGSEILDMEQVVVQGRLDLSILVRADAAWTGSSLLEDLRAAARAHGTDIETRVLEGPPPPKQPPWVLTLLADPVLDAAAIAGIAAVLARHDVNIERIQRLSESRFSTLEMTIGIADEPTVRAVRADLVRTAAALGVDVALQAEGLFRRSKRLVVFDLDSTLVRGETIDALGRRHGVGERVARVTRRAMAGEIDFAAAIRERVALLAGLPAAALVEAAQSAALTPGAAALVAALRRLGYATAIVSGGFAPVAEALRSRLDIDWAYANEVEVRDGALTGDVREPILDAEAKARIVRELATRCGISLDQVIAVGDGANDLPMLEVAGLGIAFNAKATVRAQAKHAINHPRLDAILFLLGISERERRSLHQEEP